MVNIGFTTVTFRKKSIEEILQIALAAEVNCIEWGGDVHVPPGNKERAVQIQEFSKKTGIQAISYGSYYRVGENDFEKFKNICNTALIIGAKTVRIWLGTKPGCDTMERELLQMVNEVRMLADIAKQDLLNIAFEFHHGTYNDNADNTVKFIESCKKGNIKTYWQPFADANDIENLKKLLPYLATVHVFNWDDAGIRFLLNDGTERWQEFIKIIKDKKVPCNWILEFTKDDSEENFIEDVKCLKKMLMKEEE